MPEVLAEELRFGCKWALWEHFEGEKDNYSASMKKVAWFDDAISFALAWNNIPHRDINNFFYDQEKGACTAYNVNNVEGA